MRPVAERGIPGVFAGAPGDRPGFGDIYFLWRETRAFMRAVAERLALGTPTGAPPILSRRDRLDEGRFLANDSFSHTFSGKGLCT